MNKILLLRPTQLILFLLVPLGFVVYWIPASFYKEQWETEKYFTGTYLVLYLFALFGLALGAAVGEQGVGSPKNELPAKINMLRVARGLVWVFWSLFFLMMIGYVVWVYILIKNGLTLSTLISVLSEQTNAIYDFRGYSEFIPGVTTWMQVSPVVVALGAILLDIRELNWVRRAIYFTLVICLLRAFFNSERLAFLEVLLPFFLVRIALGWRDKFPAFIVRWFIVLLIPLIFVIFFVTEIFRFWTNVGVDSGENIFTFISFHFVAYYATALNNGVLLYDFIGLSPLPTTLLNWLFNFPLVGQIVAGWFPQGYSTTPGGDLLGTYANEHYNNLSGVFPIYTDVGVWIGFLVFVLLGFLAGYAWKSFCSFNIAGLVAFPLFYMCLTEIPRVFLVSSSRFFPTWLAVGVVIIALYAKNGRASRT